MRQDELWSHLTEKNQHWLTENVTLTPDGLKKLFDTVYTQGHKQGLANGKAIQDRIKKESSKKKSNVENLFGDTFRDIF